MFDQYKLKVVAEVLEKQHETAGCAKLTNDEVLACKEVFHDLVTVGSSLGQEMLVSWALAKYNLYSAMAFHRNI